MSSRRQLRERSVWNFAAGAGDFIAKQVVGFIISPLLVNRLGNVLYGAWKILGSSTQFMSSGDVQAAQALKWIVASRPNHEAARDELARTYSATLVVTALLLPVYSIIGGVITWFAPQLTQVPSQFAQTVRVAAGVLAFAFVATQIGSVFDSVLRGMNLAYKRIGARSGITLLSGAATYFVLLNGGGITGVAIVHLLAMVLLTLLMVSVAKQHAPWLRLVPVYRNDVYRLARISSWFMIWKVVRTADTSVDVLLLGVTMGPSSVAKYSICRFSMAAGVGLINQVAAAVSPGMAHLLAKSEVSQLFKTRDHLHTFLLGAATVVGGFVLLFNEQFVQLWIGENQFVGYTANSLIVAIGIVSVIQQLDSSLINATLKLQGKITITAIGVSLFAAGAIMLSDLVGLAGFLMALLLGRIISSGGYAWSLKNIVGVRLLNPFAVLSRWMVSIAILGVCWISSHFVIVSSWTTLVLLSMGVLPLLIILSWYLVLRKETRSFVSVAADRAIKGMGK